jgi:hypothetical protein
MVGARDMGRHGKKGIATYKHVRVRCAHRGLGWLLAASLAMFGVSAQSTDRPVAAQGAEIYVVRRGWHIDVGFAAAELAPPLSSLAAALPGARFVFFGFGDRRYLESRQRRLPAMLAALWPGKGLLLTTGLLASPDEAFGAANVIRLRVSPGQARAAQAYIANSLRVTAAAAGAVPPLRFEPYPLRLGPYEGSLYYQARPAYSAVHTCNTWAAEILAAAGQPVGGARVVFAWQLWHRLQRRVPRDDIYTSHPQGGLVPS